MITIKTFVHNPIQINSYVLHDETKECVIIDAGAYNDEEIKELTIYIDENNLKPVKLLSTHYHFDHILGNKAISEIYDLSIEGHSSLKDFHKNYDPVKISNMFGVHVDAPPLLTKYLEDDEIIEFGNSKLKALHVPGHATESLVYYCEEQKFAIVGDVLFYGSIGRTDLPGGDYELLISKIKTKLLVLENDVKIYSGHGSSTTIGHERINNPFIRLLK